MDVERGRFRVAYAAAVHVALVGQDHRGRHGADRGATLVFLVVRDGAHDGRDDHRGIGLGDRAHELAAARGGDAVDELAEDRPHRRPVALDRAWRERRVDQPTQAAVIVAVDVQDVAADLFVQGPVVDPEDLGDLHPGERQRARSQEELPRLTLDDDVAERHRGEPRPVAQLAHGLMEPLAPQRGVGVVERRQLELGDRGHAAAD